MAHLFWFSDDQWARIEPLLPKNTPGRPRVDGGVTVGAYTYDSQNRRTKKVAGGNTTQYVYGLNGLLYGEYTSAGALIREYVYLDDAPLAQVDAGSPEVLTYLHTDHLGTPRFGTNTGGTQVWAWASDAFGNGTPSGVRTVNLRMPGQYYDSESSLFYNWNRYYSPSIGRYISSDPIGQEGGLNIYLYAEASPVMYADPERLLSTLIKGAKKVAKPWLPKWADEILDALDPLYIKSVADATCVQNGVNVCSTKSSTPSMSVAQPNFCPMEGSVWDDIDPDGNKGLHPNPPANASNKGGGNSCEELLAIDTNTCNMLTRFRGAAKGRICYASASERYAACLAGRPRPPLAGWN